MKLTPIFWSLLGLTTVASIHFGTQLNVMANAKSHATLTVVVDGLQSQRGQICFRVFSGDRGFPNGNESEVKSACTKITGNSVQQQFKGLKPGTYAVGVIADENGDEKLNTDWLGIPKEGFGISLNPKVSVTTGTPKFSDASFPVKKDTTINIQMKYSLDS
ncbi:DUF2141 domain-containing protein [Calothrix sp. UHCC 0171]|uniref:DUF2141 domain-containing protein n=1 Tax=Calothrix sp. UHCC 0171 TaxID=3110245 RepID=UPI002B1E9E30|nr:DUF2141 domain-containing protein [Calothrix sp. UHCC 0171]MEA5572926.1 DUF2141 domain-containing protein [Calothrix sp. UHCC 0171]